MKENQNDQKAANSPTGQQNQNNPSGKSNPANDGTKSTESTTMVEDAQETTEKEHQEDKHQHDSKTPVGQQTRTDDKTHPGKNEASGVMENKEQRSGSQNKDSRKSS